MKWYQLGLIGVGLVVAPSAHATVALVHFSEPSRGPNGSYYILVDETPFHGLDGSGTGYTNLDPQVYQHDIFVAF